MERSIKGVDEKYKMHTKKLTKSGNGRPLNIVGFDDRSQRHPDGIHLPDYMPKHEFFMLIVAPAGCGKTTLILNLLLRIYKQYFNDIIVFSPTIHNDQKWKHLTKEANVLRPNPHRALWEGKVNLEKVSASGEKGKSNGAGVDSENNPDLTPDLQSLLQTSPDTFLYETFQKPRGKNKNRAVVKEKKMGKKYLERWKAWQRATKSGEQYLPTNVQAQALLKEKQRIQGISMTIAPPTPPKLTHEMRHFRQLLGLDRTGGAVLVNDPENGVGEGIGENDDVRGNSGGMGSVSRFHVNYTPLLSGSHHHVGGINGVNSARTTFGMGTSSTCWRRHSQRRRVPYPISSRNMGFSGGDDHPEQNSDDHQTQHGNAYEEQNRQNLDGQLIGNHGQQQQQKQNKKLGVNSQRLFEEYDESTLDTLMKNQDKVVNHLTKMGKEMTDADHLCFVFDDMVGSGLFNQKRNNAFKRLTVRRRHFCSSVIGVVQAYKEFPKTSRNNTNIYILFRIESDEELSAIYKDFPCGLKPHVWLSIYKYCTREPYHFMMINLQTSDSQHRIVKNFDEPIPLPSHEEDQDAWLRSQPFYRQQSKLSNENYNAT